MFPTLGSLLSRCLQYLLRENLSPLWHIATHQHSKTISIVFFFVSTIILSRLHTHYKCTRTELIRTWKHQWSNITTMSPCDRMWAAVSCHTANKDCTLITLLFTVWQLTDTRSSHRHTSSTHLFSVTPAIPCGSPIIYILIQLLPTETNWDSMRRPGHKEDKQRKGDLDPSILLL